MSIIYQNNQNTVVTYTYPYNSPECIRIKLKVNGQPVFIYSTSVAYFACISFEGNIQVEVESDHTMKNVTIRPLSKKVQPEVDSNKLNFALSQPCNLSIEIDGELPLFFFANPIETKIPDRNDPNVLFFEEGKVYEVNELRLQENQTLYIEGGAVLKGWLRASEVNNVKVCGRGIFDGSLSTKEHKRLFVFEHCQNVSVADIILIEPAAWMLVLGSSRDILVTNLKEIGEVCCSDGIDIAGSSNVTIRGCFIRNNDDCIAIKALSYVGRIPENKYPWDNDVDNVLVEDCVFFNGPCGNALEIGYELRTENIGNITFRNCDVLCVHGTGAVFSIHNGDRATVHDVLYENIRIEHYYDKLIDFRIIESIYNRDPERGHVKNIQFKNIHAIATAHNPGHTISLIGGYDEKHIFDGVTIEDFYINEQKIMNADQLDLYIKNAQNVVFK